MIRPLQFFLDRASDLAMERDIIIMLYHADQSSAISGMREHLYYVVRLMLLYSATTKFKNYNVEF